VVLVLVLVPVPVTTMLALLSSAAGLALVGVLLQRVMVPAVETRRFN
jgi:hypothetical protein